PRGRVGHWADQRDDPQAVRLVLKRPVKGSVILVPPRGKVAFSREPPVRTGVLGGAVSDGAWSGVKPHGGPRAFNPLRVGSLEAAVWVAYYRRRWASFLVLSILV